MAPVRYRHRLLVAFAASAMVASSCASGSRRGGTGATSSNGAGPSAVTAARVPSSQVPASPKEQVPSGLAFVLGGPDKGLPKPLVAVDKFLKGGPPPDGIPSIDAPRFLPTSTVGFLADNEPVLALDIGGDARAYPIQILVWHEIVNDTVNGEPVAVTYCPLCNSAVAYDRRVGTRVLEFGTSGLLWNSALVMYDRQTQTLWSHFTGQGVVGVLTGVGLRAFPVSTVSWKTWRVAHPDGLVLSRDTGSQRDYGRNPYPGYDNVNSFPFLFEGKVDGRLTAMTRVVAVKSGESAVAVPFEALRKRRVIPVKSGRQSLVVWWESGTTSALDSAQIADGTDVGATGVFSSDVDGRTLAFRAASRGFVDTETGTVWDLLGHATDGPLAGHQLRAVEHVDTFWFAWSTFQPNTTIVE